jgi:predicted NAD/FAD-dependent oxidoreductase
VLIVGAGIAGLMAARTLTQRGFRVILLEKGHQVGGRLATRAIGPGLADYGAQFFTVRRPEFRYWVERWIDEKIIFEWSTGWSDGSLGSVPSDGHPRYAVHGGMRALAIHLAQDLNIFLTTRLVSVAPNQNGWLTLDDKGQSAQAQALLLTPPVPHALDLLNTGGVSLQAAQHAALVSIDYAPCLTGLFWVNGEIRLPPPGAVQRPNAAITWIADNRRKGISPDITLITVQAGPEYSRQIWGMSDWEALLALESGLRVYKDYETPVLESHLERWRCSMPTSIYPARCMVAEGLPLLVFAGDAFGGPRIEGAALSGLSAGAALAAKII